MNALAQPGALIIFGMTIGASLLGLFAIPAIIEKSLFRPYWFVRAKQYATVISSGFVHADVGHLFFNMVTFWFFAFSLEAHIGTPAFVMLYLVGLLLSHACTFFKHSNNREYASLGASGAISAVLFAFIVYFPTTTLMILPIPVPIPAALFAVAYVAYSYWASTQQRGGINHDAHLCGALAGLVFVALTDPGAFRNLGQVFG